MKKSFLFIIVVVLLCVGSLFTCFAAYSYASPPQGGAWNFASNRSYTINGECDIYYYKGSNGFLGIGRETTKVRSSTKAIPYWYGSCIAAVKSSSGKFEASYSGAPDTSNIERHSGWADAGNIDAPQMVQYEYSFFQVSYDTAINTRHYFYDSIRGFS
ncbi:MAG: hypothetical protein ACLSVG_01105 [Clostridia bacterium]